MTHERRISSEILAEMIKEFKVLTLQSTINDFSFYNSEEDDAESDPKTDQLVATHTSDRKKKKSLILTLPTEILHKTFDQPAHPRDHPSHNPAD